MCKLGNPIDVITYLCLKQRLKNQMDLLSRRCGVSLLLTRITMIAKTNICFYWKYTHRIFFDVAPRYHYNSRQHMFLLQWQNMFAAAFYFTLLLSAAQGGANNTPASVATSKTPGTQSKELLPYHPMFQGPSNTP